MLPHRPTSMRVSSPRTIPRRFLVPVVRRGASDIRVRRLDCASCVPLESWLPMKRIACCRSGAVSAHSMHCNITIENTL